MNFSFIKKLGAAILCLTVLIQAGAAAASANINPSPPAELIPLGHTAGVRLLTDGLVVIGLTQVNTADGVFAPAIDVGILEGDIITHANSIRLESVGSLRELVQKEALNGLSLRLRREGRTVDLKITPALSEDGNYKLGVWLRDSMSGIGTLTFYDPQTKTFGALGHGVNDVDTLQLMPLHSGTLLKSTVVGIKKGQPGTPGELIGSFTPIREIGAIFVNSDSGIFGILTDLDVLKGKTSIAVAPHAEAQAGKASIISNIDGDKTESFDIEITRVFPDAANTTRNMTIEITDKKLLELTGGIVQGMSGSPIIQNGKLIGAVTHVLINEPQKGYGIFIENMLANAYYSEKLIYSDELNIA